MCKSLMRKSIAVAFAFLVASIVGAPAQNYPDRSIKVVVPYPAGGPTDTIARAVTQSLVGRTRPECRHREPGRRGRPDRDEAGRECRA